ncbi:MAG: LamG-like jellyroll fold domain-containing protein, partial [Caldilineaceae bacterium]
KRVVNIYTYDFESGVGPEWSSLLPDAVLNLKLDEAAGATVFADSSGAGHNATCDASTCPQAGVAGRFGQAARFSGQDQYLSTSAGASVEMGRGDFTISAWINTTDTYMGILTKNNDDLSWQSGERVFYLNPSGLPAFSGFNNGYIFGKTPVNDGKWHHLAVVWDYSGSGTGGVAKMYVDGIDDTDPTYQYLANNADNAGNTVKIGQTNDGKMGYFSGTLDEVRVFNTALNPSEIYQVAFGTLDRLAPNGPGETYWTGGGAYWLGNFDNERVTLTLSDLPAHDTVKVRFNLVTSMGFNGWEGNMTAEGRGPDRWEWGDGDTALLNTSFAAPNTFQCDSNATSCWGLTQAYPGAYVAQVADGLEIGVPAQPQFFYQDVPNFAGTPVGDNPQFGWTSVLFQSAAKVYQNANYGGAAQIFDPFAGITSLKAQWPSWVSSMRIWPAQHAAQAGSIAYADTASTFDGPIYALEGAISDHTADSIDIYFEGQTATSDPDGVENWALDNVQVTLERDETSIPLNNQSFTLAAWAKRSTTGNWDPIITQGPNGTDQHLYFGFRGDQPNVFTCAFSKVGNALKSPSAYTDLDWHHWVCTYDVATNTRILYRDGVEIASDTAAGSHSGLGTTYIGRNVTTETFHGQIDEIGVWRQPLTAADVAALYNKVKAEDQSVMVGTLFAVDGSTTVAGSEVVLRETATNVGAVQQTTARTLTVDPDNPTVCPDASQCPLNGQYVQNRGTLIMAGTAQDPTSYIERVEVDNGGWQTLTGTAAWSYAWDMSAQADGEHTLPVRATDAVGNVSPVYAINVIVDSTPPQPAFATGTADAQRPSQDAQGNWSVTLAGTVSDPNAGSNPAAASPTSRCFWTAAAPWPAKVGNRLH